MYLTRLRYFVVTAEEGSVIAAAQRLRVAQPALSRQLRVLERTVGTPLFERHARGVRLLPAGTVFLEHARRLLSDATTATEAARRAAGDSLQRHVRVAPPDWAHRTMWVADAADRLPQECPHLSVEFQAIPWLLHAAAVHDGQIDIGFGVGMSVADFGEGLIADRLCDEPGSSAVLPLTHPLARRSSIRLAELRDLTTLIPARDVAPLLHDHMLAMIRTGGYEPRVGVAGPSFSETMQLVAAGAGWVLAINSVREATPPAIAVVPIVDATVMLGFYALRRKDNERVGIRAFMTHLGDVESERRTSAA